MISPQVCSWIKRWLDKCLGGNTDAGCDDDASDELAKLVVFAHHRRVLNALQRLLERERVAFIRLDGSTPHALRHAQVRRFRQESAIR